MSSHDSGRGHRRRDAGQAAVEFALALPLLAVAMFGAAQVVDIAADRLAVGAAARAGARAAASASASTAAATTAAHAATSTRPLRVEVSENGTAVTVTVTHVNPTAVPLIGALLGDVELVATATMPLEPP
jgi:Flp pilus assembly protein TadG